MDSVYPVGSLYFCTQSTCPLASLISGSTWEKVGTKLLTDVTTKISSDNTTPSFILPNGTTGYLCTHGGGYYRNNTLWLSGSSGNQLSQSEGIVTGFGSQTGLMATNSKETITVNIFKRTA